MRVVITNYTGDRQNWGCQSTSIGLKRFLMRHMPGVNISTLPLRAKFPRLKRVSQKDIRAELLAILRGQRVATRLLEAVYEEDEIRLLRDADIVLFQGEGTMVGTRFYNGENLFIAPIAAAKLFKRTVWSINQTVFSLDDGFSDFMVEAYLTAFERNYLREPASLEYLRSLGVANCALLPDMAFYDSVVEDASHAKGQYAAMSGMARIERLPSHMFEERAGALIDRYSKLVFLASTNMDTAMAERLKLRFGGSIEIVGADSERHQAFSAIRSSAVFVSGRYHMNIFSAKAGTPFLPFLSNTHKNYGLSQMLGYPIEPRALDEGNSLVPDLDFIEREQASLRERLRARVDEIVDFLDQANIFSNDGAAHDFFDRCRRSNAGLGQGEYTYFRRLNAPMKKIAEQVPKSG